jgi:hypothetical protein
MGGGQFGHHGALDSLFLPILHRDAKSTIDANMLSSGRNLAN